MVTDRAVEYIARNATGDRPFFLFVPFAFAHHPALAHPDFKGKSPAGEFGDSLLEHDYHVGGRILDAVTQAGIADNTVVLWASDNGPSPLPTVTPWWTIGDAGPWRGEIGTVLEGNIRTSCLVRWPGQIPGGHLSNQVVAAVDFFPTLARIAGAKVPKDRPIDGVDQLDFFMGRQEKSNREHVLLFLGQKLMAVKWRNYKIHLNGLDSVDGVMEDWSFPRAFNLAADPKERWNIIWQNSWLGEAIAPFVVAYELSVKKYPNLPPGGPTTVCHAMAKTILPPKQEPKACNTSCGRSASTERADMQAGFHPVGEVSHEQNSRRNARPPRGGSSRVCAGPGAEHADRSGSARHAVSLALHERQGHTAGHAGKWREGRHGTEAYWNLPADSEQRASYDKEIVLEVADGIWTFGSPSIVNSHAVQGPDGLIIYDTGENVEDGERFYRLLRSATDAPIRAIIYEHEHYAHGTKAFLDAEAKRGNIDVKIIGHPGLNAEVARTGGTFTVHPEISSVLLARALEQFNGYLPDKGPDAAFKNTITLGVDGFVPVNTPVQDGQTMKAAGLDLV